MRRLIAGLLPERHGQQFYASAKDRRMGLPAAWLGSWIRDVFRLTGLDAVISIHDTRSAALSAQDVLAEAPVNSAAFEVASESLG